MEKSKKTLGKLYFAYNAKGGFFNGLTDSIHKIVSPSTYSCDLCAITHHSAGMKFTLKRFLEKLPYEVNFVYKDDLKKYPFLKSADLPCIFVSNDKDTSIVLAKDEISKIKSAKNLEKEILKKIAK